MELIIYNNTDEFLKQIEQLEQEYNNISYFYKFLKTKAEFNIQTNYLKKFELLSFHGFFSKGIIKLVIRDNTGSKFCIQYKFPKEKRKYNLRNDK